MEVNKKRALKKVAYWDDLENQRPLSPNELEERLVAIEDFKKWSLMEETSCRQKSREIRLKEGDRNTGFFHKMANSHSRRNSINKIQIGGEWLMGAEDLRSGVVNAYRDLLSNPGEWRASPKGLNLSRLEERESANLEMPFTESDVKNALDELNGDKAPGPDGFTVAFWQSNWDIVRVDVMELFQEFYESGRFVRSLNAWG